MLGTTIDYPVPSFDYMIWASLPESLEMLVK